MTPGRGLYIPGGLLAGAALAWIAIDVVAFLLNPCGLLPLPTGSSGTTPTCYSAASLLTTLDAPLGLLVLGAGILLLVWGIRRPFQETLPRIA